LVACAVKITSAMGEVEIRQVIFVVFVENPITDFSFVRAVGDVLICPANILEWNYKTIKHVYQNGPIYIRAENSIKGFESDEEEFEDICPRPTRVSKINVNDESSSSKSTTSSSKEECSSGRKLLTCPICYQKFPMDELDNHADRCAERKYDFIDYSSDEVLEIEKDGELIIRNNKIRINFIRISSN